MKFLFITSFPPFPIDRSGGGIRSRLIIDALNKIGTVSIFYLNYRSGDKNSSDEIYKLLSENSTVLEQSIQIGDRRKFITAVDKIIRGFKFIFGDRFSAAGLKIDQNARQTLEAIVSLKKYDVVFGRCSRPTAVSGILDIEGIPLIVDADDWEPSRVDVRLKIVKKQNVFVRLYLHRLKKGSDYLGRRILDRAQHVFLASETDTKKLNKNIVSTLPNLPLSDQGGEIISLPPSDPHSKTFFAVGQWSKNQNSDGMFWFLESCWPRILLKVPDARFRIAGGLTKKLSSRWSRYKNVELLGFVENLAIEYERAAVIVVPITWGGGTKIKTLEALAYGRVPIGSSHAFDGLAELPIPIQAVSISDDPEMLALNAVRLLNDYDFRLLRENDIEAYYHNNYSISKFEEILTKTVKDLS